MFVILPEIIAILKLLYTNIRIRYWADADYVWAKLIAKQSWDNIPGGSLIVKRGVENYPKSETSKIFK